jgi:hypothetical protein
VGFLQGPISGDVYDGIYEGMLTFSQFSELGTWYARNVRLADSQNNFINVWENEIIDMGFPTELNVVSEPTIEGILIFFDQAVAAETLTGHGPGNSADGRLYALRSMLVEAGFLIDSGMIEEACGQLMAAYKKCDGDPAKPDFAIGEALAGLSEKILGLLEVLGCE